MLSVVSILTSLLLATASTTAGPMQARAGACNPAVAGQGINIVNGQFQLGYPSGDYFPNVPIEAEGLTVPLVPVFNVDPSGNGLLSIVDAPAGASPLYPTNVNRTQMLLEPRITAAPGNFTQGWSYVCSNCDDPTVAYGCEVVSDATGQCVQIGTAVGQPASIAQCSGLPYGNQAFDIFIS
ncbi:hypothetical protein DFH07DRAFT_769817 [Mycena maculata]|uniref:Uncharacterized protein n=1 Tax=Mycena maculata TaxID=230809 RepID=A0AAD7JK58_9AGAR|nr:hypothetical protein DFH07DRAFT_769817 [Mycena maculata]